MLVQGLPKVAGALPSKCRKPGWKIMKYSTTIYGIDLKIKKLRAAR